MVRRSISRRAFLAPDLLKCFDYTSLMVQRAARGERRELWMESTVGFLAATPFKCLVGRKCEMRLVDRCQRLHRSVWKGRQPGESRGPICPSFRQLSLPTTETDRTQFRTIRDPTDLDEDEAFTQSSALQHFSRGGTCGRPPNWRLQVPHAPRTVEDVEPH